MRSSASRSELEVLECLRSSAVFGALTESTLRKLSDRLKPEALTAGSVLFSQGESADALYVVLTGELDAFAQRPGGTELPLWPMQLRETVRWLASLQLALIRKLGTRKGRWKQR